MESLYQSYSNRLGVLETFENSHPKLKVKLFKDRAEFRRINPTPVGLKLSTVNPTAGPTSQPLRSTRITDAPRVGASTQS